MLFLSSARLRRLALVATTASLLILVDSYGHAAPPTAKATVQQRPVMTGTVIDAGSGVPLPGAIVYVYTAAPRTGTSPFCPSCYVDCGKRGGRNMRGAFQIPVSARSLIFRLLVVRDGYEPTFVRGVDPLDAKSRRVALKKLGKEAADPSHVVTGRVLDGAGQPVVGATVEPIGRKSPQGEIYGTIPGVEPLAITNEKGLFCFHTVSPNTTLMAKVQARNLATTIVRGLSTGNQKPHDVRMAVGTTVTGTLRNASGQAMPGMAVVQVVHANRSVMDFVGWFEIGTDKDGHFSLPNIPAGRDYVVCVRMDSLNGSALGATRQTLTTGKDNTTRDGLVLTLQPTTTVKGKVTLSEGKALPAGMRLLLSRKDTWDVQQALLGKDGSFTFREVPQGEDFELYVHVEGYRLADNTDPYAEYSLKTTVGKSEENVMISLVFYASKKVSH